MSHGQGVVGSQEERGGEERSKVFKGSRSPVSACGKTDGPQQGISSATGTVLTGLQRSGLPRGGRPPPGGATLLM